MTAPLELAISSAPIRLRAGTMAPAQDILVMPVSGPAGPPGGTEYVHTQSTAAATWVIDHNLNRHPQVTVADGSGQVVLADVIYSSPNTITVVFASPTTGVAYLG